MKNLKLLMRALGAALSIVTAAQAAPDISCNVITKDITFSGNGAVVVEKNGPTETNLSSNFTLVAGLQYKLKECKNCKVAFTDTTNGPGSSIISHITSTYFTAGQFCYLAHTITSLGTAAVPAGLAGHAAEIKAGLAGMVGYSEKTLEKSTVLYHGTPPAGANSIITDEIKLVGNGITGLGFYTSSDRKLAVAFGHLNANPCTVIKLTLKKDLPVCKIPPALKNENLLNIFPINNYRALLSELGVDCALMRNNLSFHGVTGTEVVFWQKTQLGAINQRQRQNDQ
jgi:hypothetical protein